MNIFFDNCTSPVLATTLDGFIRHENHHAFHIKDLPCGRHASDLEWIEMLQKDNAVWVVVTGDGRIRRNQAERAAYRRAGLRGFVLAAAYQKTPIHKCAAFMIWRWPDMENLLKLVAGAALYELPMNRSSRMRQLPL